MARQKFVAGNWKMNTTKAQAIDLAKGVAAGVGSGVQVGVAVPFVYIDAVKQSLGSSTVLVGAQDAYFEKSGAFTGEISVDMLKDVGAAFALSGHSERRHVLHETPELIGKKAKAIYGGGLILIHCVGEKLEERDANKTLDVCRAQIDELDSAAMTDPSRVVIAYEPVWAIGTGRNATDAQAQEVHAFIREYIGKKWNTSFADAVRIQYGGSMKPENAKGLLAQPDVDGGLIGGAALKADSFLAIVNAGR
ncbi:MAG TPA: triose-phosphate isomerase [Tepidisphaeraceae bacterium]|jgi:triosephosphate isomerase